MNHSRFTWQKSSPARCWPAALAALLVSAVVGCRSGVYRATSLPPELQAKPTINVQQLDLSRLADATAKSDVIYPGDVVQVRIATGAEQKEPPAWDLRVAPDGTVTLPQIGPVAVARLNVTQAEQAIRQAGTERGIYRDPAVTVLIAQRRTNRITVAGAVNSPGTYELPAAGSSLAAALLAAGGLKKEADRFVEIRYPDAKPHSMSLASFSRPDRPAAGAPASTSPAGVTIDLAEAIALGRSAFRLEDGAMVIVHPKSPRYVHVIGLAGNRAIELPPDRDVRLLEALAQAGGPRFSIWIADQVQVIRRTPDGDGSVTIKLSISKAKRDGRENIVLAPGDIISVEENLITFTLGTLRDLVGIGATAAQGAAAAVP